MVPKECHRIGARSDTAYRMGWGQGSRRLWCCEAGPAEGQGRRSSAATAQGSRELPNAAARLPHPTDLALLAKFEQRALPLLGCRQLEDEPVNPLFLVCVASLLGAVGWISKGRRFGVRGRPPRSVRLAAAMGPCFREKDSCSSLTLWSGSLARPDPRAALCARPRNDASNLVGFGSLPARWLPCCSAEACRLGR